jgi:predicted N-acetyltransferase YhbS
MDVLGYYYLMATSVESEEAARAAGGPFEQLPKIPALWLGMIGVHSSHVREGLGDQLMIHAFRQVVQVSKLAGVWALTLDAVDEEAVTYYERFDFKRFKDGGLEMYLPVGTIQQLIEELDTAAEPEEGAA